MTFSRTWPRRAALALLFALCTFVPAGAQQAQGGNTGATPGSNAAGQAAGKGAQANAAQGSSQSPTVRVTLLQVNDVYQISPVDRGTRGGLARVAALRKKIMQESPHTLYLLAGDTIAPSVASNIFKGRQMIATWNVTGLDLAVLGNHEFDFGDEVLRERMKDSRFTWLGSNVFDRKTGKLFGGMPPFVIREFEGVRVGFFGVLTPETKNASKPSENVEFRDPCETAKEVVPQIRARGAQVVVAVTHLTMAQDKALARCAPIDVTIGGHEHTLLQSLSGRTPIFKMGSDARNLGRIDLNISRATGALDSIDWEVIPVTSDIKEEPEAAALVETYEKRLSAELDKPVGVTKAELDARQSTNRSRETNLGSFIADTYRKWGQTDVALFNGGSIRSNTTYGPGTLTKRDILSILPFENHIVKVEITGKTLRAALEHGVSRIMESAEEGRFPQVSGLTFTYDGRRPSGQRVVEVTVGGRPLDDAKTYTLATVAYLVGGGDGYTMLSNSRYLFDPEGGPVEAALLMDAIAAAKEINPQPDGRIRRLDDK